MNQQTIIIIGATSGIGRELFERYAADGNRIGIVGRRTHLLDELRQEHPDTTITATADITKQNEIARAIDALHSELKDIDLASFAQGWATSMPRWTTLWSVRLLTPTSWAGRSLSIHFTTYSGSKATATSSPSPRLVDCAARRWLQPTAHRKPIKSTTWKPCVRRLIRAVTIFILPTSALASSIQQWPKAKDSSG